MSLVVFLDTQGTGGRLMYVQGRGKREVVLVLVFAASCQPAVVLPLGLDLMIRMVNGTPITLDRD